MIFIVEEGDFFVRFKVRIAEIEQSLQIIEQVFSIFLDGFVMFKKLLCCFKIFKGEYYFVVESVRGFYGQYIQVDGIDCLVKIKLCMFFFVNFFVMFVCFKNMMVVDTIMILGSIDFVMSEVDW